MKNKKCSIKPEDITMLNDLCRKTYQELKELNIPVFYPSTVAFKNLPCTLGLCQRIYDYKFLDDDTIIDNGLTDCMIYIASRIKNKPALLREVMAHELLHTAARGRHRGNWLAYVYIAEWKYHYGMLKGTTKKGGRFKYQCKHCGQYAFRESPTKDGVRCTFCNRAMERVNKIDHSYERGPEKIEPKYKKMIAEFLETGNMPERTNGF